MSQWYGSLNNRLAERSIQPEPEIGMGVTEMMWSDTHAYEVVAIKDSKHITVRRMKATCEDYFAGKWAVESDPDGYTINLFKTKNGWRERIGKNGLGNSKFVLGYAREYQDPSF